MGAAKRPVILYVEDDPDTRDLVQKALKSLYEVVALSYGEGTPDMAKAYSPDLIILDVGLPGISGYQVCRDLRDTPETRRIPILFLTAFSGEEAFSEGLAAGCDSWMNKPIDVAELLQRVACMLKESNRISG
jgi:DNA-binding response OmpR family regulator